jgi:hypothetical protein
VKKIIIKIVTLMLLIGGVGLGYGVWDIIKKSGVNKEVKSFGIEDIQSFNGDLLYARINGGRLDISNTYEYSVSTRRTDVKLSSAYFTPVVNGKNSQVAYIIKTDIQPTASDMLVPADYSGLLQSESELPNKIRKAFVETFPSTQLRYLDTTYRPLPILDQLIDLKIFLLLLLAGLVLRIALTRSGKRGHALPEGAGKPV